MATTQTQPTGSSTQAQALPEWFPAPATGFQAEVIQALQNAGFAQTSGGVVTHLDHGDFASWEAAAIACIIVAGN